MPKQNKPNFVGTGALCIEARKLPVKGVAMKCLLLYYAICTDYSTGTFYKSFSEIYADTGIPERTVRRVNDGLARAKILETTPPKFESGDATVYRLNLKTMQNLNEQLIPLRSERQIEARKKKSERMQRWRDKKKVLKTEQILQHV